MQLSGAGELKDSSCFSSNALGRGVTVTVEEMDEYSGGDSPVHRPNGLRLLNEKNENNGTSYYQSRLSESMSASKLIIKQVGGGIEHRKSIRYKDILMGLGRHEKLQPISPSIKRQINDRADNLLNIIQSCDSLRNQYGPMREEWSRSIEREQEEIDDTHKRLEKQTFRKRLLILKPEHTEMIKRVLPNRLKWQIYVLSNSFAEMYNIWSLVEGELFKL